MKRRFILAVGATAAVSAAILTGSSRAAPITVTGTTTQLTTNLGAQIDPSVSGNLVVFTDQRNGNDDIFYVDLATGTEVQVTTSTHPDRLHDVSGTTIVYSDLSPPTARVIAYDVPTGTFSVVGTPGTHDVDPRIDGDIVVFERGTSGATDVIAVDLATNIETVVAGTAAVETNPSVSGRFVVYERSTTATSQGDIVLFNLDTGVETSVAATAADQRQPDIDIDGGFVVYDVMSAGLDLDVGTYEIATGTTTVYAAAGDQRRPHISGTLASYDDNSAGNPDVVLLDAETGATEAIATELGRDFLNDIDGHRIVYTSNQAGNFDTWLFEFTVPPSDTIPPELTVPADFSLDATGSAGALVTYAASASDNADPSPSLVCVPASGTVFAIGTTSVTCTATDSSGNSANAGFSVHVRGASEQIVALIDKTVAFVELPALEATLRARLGQAAAALVANNKPLACTALNLYIGVVRLVPASVLSAAEKSELIADANRIRAVIGCV